MATNYLDTGDTGRAVSSESDGALFAGIFGSAKYVLENGSQFKAEVQSNNIVKISDGDAVMYGRHVRIPANDSALVTINNGHSGTNRVDLIVFRYTKDSTGKETVDLVVIQGEDSTGTATAPTAVDGNILTGAMQSDFPLYSVELNGINIVKVNPLFNVIGNISKLKEELTELNSKTQILNSPINISEFSSANFQCKIIRYGRLRILHAYNGTDLTLENTVIYTLQERDRPSKQYSFGSWVVKDSSSAYGSTYLEVNTDGTVVITKGSVCRGMLIGVWITE